MSNYANHSNTIRKLCAFVTFLSFLLTGCHISSAGLANVVGSGDIVTVERELEDFHKVRVGSALIAVIEHGEQSGVSITADDNVIENIETAVASNGTLIVRRAPGTNLQTKSPIRVHITTPKCTSVVVSGASAVSLKEFDQEELRTKVSGASKFTLDSRVNHLELQASGASKVYADHHSAMTVDVELSGASQISVAAADTLEGSVSGASSVTYSGEPDHVALKTSGASRVKRQKSES